MQKDQGSAKPKGRKVNKRKPRKKQEKKPNKLRLRKPKLEYGNGFRSRLLKATWSDEHLVNKTKAKFASSKDPIERRLISRIEQAESRMKRTTDILQNKVPVGGVPISIGHILRGATPPEYKMNAAHGLGGISLKKHEYCFPIIQNNANTFQNAVYPLTPVNSALFPWAQGISIKYEQWCLESVKFTFTPSCPTTTGGNLMFMWDPDIADPMQMTVPTISQGDMMGSQFSLMTECWRDATFRIPRASQVKWFFVDDNTGPNIGAAVDDSRLTTDGALYVASTASTTGIIGHLWVDVVIGLREPQMGTNPTNFAQGGCKASDNSTAPFFNFDQNTVPGVTISKVIVDATRVGGYNAITFMNPGFYMFNINGTAPNTGTAPFTNVEKPTAYDNTNIIVDAAGLWAANQAYSDILITVLKQFCRLYLYHKVMGYNQMTTISQTDVGTFYYRMLQHGRSHAEALALIEPVVAAHSALLKPIGVTIPDEIKRALVRQRMDMAAIREKEQVSGFEDLDEAVDDIEPEDTKLSKHEREEAMRLYLMTKRTDLDARSQLSEVSRVGHKTK